MARITHEELEKLFSGYGWAPIFVEGSDPEVMHQLMAAALDRAVDQIKQIRKYASEQKDEARPRWPMIVLRSPKGWTGPQFVDNRQIEGTFRAHQIPLPVSASTPAYHLQQLETWMKSYRPEELFDDQGHLLAELAALAPKGGRRMGANPHANGGILLKHLRLPDFRAYGLDVPVYGSDGEGDVHVTGCHKRAAKELI